MLREGIARARGILQEASDDAAGGGRGSAGERGKRRREEAEAKRLSGLELGEGARFAALAEKCLDLNEGVRSFSRQCFDGGGWVGGCLDHGGCFAWRSHVLVFFVRLSMLGLD